ncbi:MAG: hypothetical protein BJ554DRAFT_6932 [Olpidium bornovanus]|uniref:DUF1772 domain-containing protein n=1 Tax=Olpidium bornovanus TaxID=278681 RepID=A0A8H8DKB9_9FUNG|nr:MAG: hypothetical protein BJ554DRAFT_6932 [Olpidium bornovanus]
MILLNNNLLTLHGGVLLTTALFTGGSLYASLVDVPLLASLKPARARDAYRVVFNCGEKLQGGLVAVSAVGSLLALRRAAPDDRPLYGIAAAALGLGVAGFSGAVMFPDIKKLMDSSVALDDNATRRMLVTWGNRHWVRTVSGFVALAALALKGSIKW